MWFRCKLKTTAYIGTIGWFLLSKAVDLIAVPRVNDVVEDLRVYSCGFKKNCTWIELVLEPIYAQTLPQLEDLFKGLPETTNDFITEAAKCFKNNGWTIYQAGGEAAIIMEMAD